MAENSKSIKKKGEASAKAKDQSESTVQKDGQQSSKSPSSATTQADGSSSNPIQKSKRAISPGSADGSSSNQKAKLPVVDESSQMSTKLAKLDDGSSSNQKPKPPQTQSGSSNPPRPLLTALEKQVISKKNEADESSSSSSSGEESDEEQIDEKDFNGKGMMGLKLSPGDDGYSDQDSEEGSFDMEEAEEMTRNLFDSFDGPVSVSDKGVLGPWLNDSTRDRIVSLVADRFVSVKGVEHMLMCNNNYKRQIDQHGAKCPCPGFNNEEWVLTNPTKMLTNPWAENARRIDEALTRHRAQADYRNRRPFRVVEPGAYNYHAATQLFWRNEVLNIKQYGHPGQWDPDQEKELKRQATIREREKAMLARGARDVPDCVKALPFFSHPDDGISTELIAIDRDVHFPTQTAGASSGSDELASLKSQLEEQGKKLAALQSSIAASSAAAGSGPLAVTVHHEHVSSGIAVLHATSTKEWSTLVSEWKRQLTLGDIKDGPTRRARETRVTTYVIDSWIRHIREVQKLPTHEQPPVLAEILAYNPQEEWVKWFFEQAHDERWMSQLQALLALCGIKIDREGGESTASTGTFLETYAGLSFTIDWPLRVKQLDDWMNSCKLCRETFGKPVLTEVMGALPSSISSDLVEEQAEATKRWMASMRIKNPKSGKNQVWSIIDQDMERRSFCSHAQGGRFKMCVDVESMFFTIFMEQVRIAKKAAQQTRSGGGGDADAVGATSSSKFHRKRKLEAVSEEQDQSVPTVVASGGGGSSGGGGEVATAKIAAGKQKRCQVCNN
jgi:hypothetical protein